MFVICIIYVLLNYGTNYPRISLIKYILIYYFLGIEIIIVFSLLNCCNAPFIILSSYSLQLIFEWFLHYFNQSCDDWFSTFNCKKHSKFNVTCCKNSYFPSKIFKNVLSNSAINDVNIKNVCSFLLVLRIGALIKLCTFFC